VVQPAIAQMPQARHPRRLLQRRPDHVLFENLPRHLDRRHLQLLLGAEVREQPALAHLQFVCQPPDTEAFQPLHRCQVHRHAQNPLPGALTLGASRNSAGGRHGHHSVGSKIKIARTFVFVPYSPHWVRIPWLASLSSCYSRSPSPPPPKKSRCKTATSCPSFPSASREANFFSSWTPPPRPCSISIPSPLA